jgi:hypothetical protein
MKENGRIFLLVARKEVLNTETRDINYSGKEVIE